MSRGEADHLLTAVEAVAETDRIAAHLVSRPGQERSDPRDYHIEMRWGSFSGGEIAALQAVAEVHGAHITVTDHKPSAAYLNETTILRFNMVAE